VLVGVRTGSWELGCWERRAAGGGGDDEGEKVWCWTITRGRYLAGKDLSKDRMSSSISK